jgi:hypothetical protein
VHRQGFKKIWFRRQRGGFFCLAFKKHTTAECINIYGLVSKSLAWAGGELEISGVINAISGDQF